MTHDSRLMNYLVRMVVPLRREFGRSLDVHHFLHDLSYAKEVLEDALKSQDPRLREYASYVQQLLHGPRVPAAPPPPPAPADAPAAKAAAKPAAPEDAQAEALKQQIMKKYTSGLR